MKPTFPISLTIFILAQQAQATGFFDDSKAVIKLRNFYINSDYRDAATPAQKAANQSYQSEWGQAFQLEFNSGYTPGLIGFGVDALGMLGIRLDSSGGKHGNPTGSNYGGVVFPSDGDHAVNDMSSLGLTGKVKVSNTELKLGTLVPKLPVIFSNDGRLLPQTWQGTQVTSTDIKDLTLTGGQIDKVKGRNSSNNENMSIAGANNAATGHFSNKFVYAGVDYKPNKNLTLQYYYGNLKDFYKQNFFGLTHSLDIGPGILTSDLRYFISTDDGANAYDPGYFTTGYYGNGTLKGKVDNDLYSGLFTYSVAGSTFGLGYEVSDGKSDFPYLNQGDGPTTYTITEMQIQKFVRAGEKSWQARYSFDFAKIGLPGASAGVVYVKGNDIDTLSSSSSSEWERDVTLSYVIQSGPFKGLGFMWKNAMVRNNIPNNRQQDENRVIINYQLALF
ncbi:OprD family porin [Pseudomonas sp. HN2-3]|uniref:OprD family porin n=1 Tax=Pseudomonas sp. HN2-3 TaxID=2886360 RepID=UPI001D0FBDB1|nr:OprD family porin [Pseudomonas sp. HN2-3]UDU83165.1 OprD family porin [Pseudomonas sp. HN2-3]